MTAAGVVVGVTFQSAQDGSVVVGVGKAGVVVAGSQSPQGALVGPTGRGPVGLAGLPPCPPFDQSPHCWPLLPPLFELSEEGSDQSPHWLLLPLLSVFPLGWLGGWEPDHGFLGGVIVTVAGAG